MILRRSSCRPAPSNWLRARSAGGELVAVAYQPIPSCLAKPFCNQEIPLLARTPPSDLWCVIRRPGDTGGDSPGADLRQAREWLEPFGFAVSRCREPLNGAPALAHAPQLNPAAGIPEPLLQQSFRPAERAFGWALGAFDFASRSSNFLGWISFTVPAGAQAGQGYKLSFANADGAPDLQTQYDLETRSASIAVYALAPPASTCADEWKLHYFESLDSSDAADLADPDGDGVSNAIDTSPERTRPMPRPVSS